MNDQEFFYEEDGVEDEKASEKEMGIICKSINKPKQKQCYTEEDDEYLLSLVSKYGKKWKKFTCYFPGRNERMLRNRYLRLNQKKGIKSKQIQSGFESSIKEFSQTDSLCEN